LARWYGRRDWVGCGVLPAGLDNLVLEVLLGLTNFVQPLLRLRQGDEATAGTGALAGAGICLGYELIELRYPRSRWGSTMTRCSDPLDVSIPRAGVTINGGINNEDAAKIRCVRRSGMR
jgi:hypothetical protein